MILCVGATPTVQRTLTFGRLHLDAVNRAAGVIESASGKSVNVARTLRILGHEVLATGFLGGDSGRFVRDDLDSLGIPHAFVEVAAKTRTCTTVLDKAGPTVTELVEETRPVPAAAYTELLQSVEANLFRARVLVLSGSLTPGAPDNFYAHCAAAARQADVPVIIDGRGPSLRHALPEAPQGIKPNRGELGDTVGQPVATDEQLRAAVESLVRRGPRWIVVTDGPRDAIASNGQQFWRVTPPHIEPVNPIGSGDAFAAGMAVAVAAGKDLAEACRLGAACGAANALGPAAGHARRDDVERLLPLVGISPWVPLPASGASQ